MLAWRWVEWLRSPGGRLRRRRVLLNKAVDEKVFRQAAEAALHGAVPQSENGFKVELAKRCVVHALGMATWMVA